ncbi:MAG: hypothetical protein M3R63_19265 [Actinomycetota bacterium]|nr:hypothetical protein [Actinomycetota bacterium]
MHSLPSPALARVEQGDSACIRPPRPARHRNRALQPRQLTCPAPPPGTAPSSAPTASPPPSSSTGDVHHRTDALRTLATELRRETEHLDAPALPTTLPEVTGLVDTGDGVRFGELIAALGPDPDTAAQALTDLLAAAATLPDQPGEHTVAPLLAEWEPVIAAVTAAATTGRTPTDLADVLNQLGDSTDWAALVAALRRVLAGDRDREQLLVGLDEVGIAILTATLDRLSTDHGQDS